MMNRKQIIVAIIVITIIILTIVVIFKVTPKKYPDSKEINFEWINSYGDDGRGHYNTPEIIHYGCPKPDYPCANLIKAYTIDGSYCNKKELSQLVDPKEYSKYNWKCLISKVNVLSHGDYYVTCECFPNGNKEKTKNTGNTEHKVYFR